MILSKWLDSSIGPMDRTITDTTTTLGQSEPVSNGDKEALNISQTSKTGPSPTDYTALGYQDEYMKKDVHLISLGYSFIWIGFFSTLTLKK